MSTEPAHLPDDEAEIQRLVAALGDGTRRRVFFVVREADGLVGKDEVAEAVGITRRLAGFHLVLVRILRVRVRGAHGLEEGA